jgi:alpha-galactosidase
MMLTLQNNKTIVSFNPNDATFSVTFGDQRQVSLQCLKLSVLYHQGDTLKKQLSDNWTFQVIDDEYAAPDIFKSLRNLNFTITSPEDGLQFHLRFALPEDKMMFLWQVEVENLSTTSVYMERIELMRTDPSQSSIILGNRTKLKRPAFFSNGWQSWAYTATFGVGEKGRHTNLPAFQNPLVHNDGTPQPRSNGHFGSDFFGVLGDRETRSGVLMGFLSQLEQFGSVEADLRGQPNLAVWANMDNIRLEPGKSVKTDWAVIQAIDLDDFEPLGEYYEAVARTNRAKRNGYIPAGWCSWYHFYQNVKASDIVENLKIIKEVRPSVPVELIQIDDGFQSQVGDWLTFDKSFPDGVAPLAEMITQEGFTPGLWLAPFIVHPKSELFKGKPEYILRDRKGKPVNAGFIWNVFTTALDLTHPEALDYATEVVRTAAKDWGFPYLKLDFLYAAALPGVFQDRTKTRAHILRMGFEAIRQAVGEETYLLGCGAPLGPALGIFDAMRIGADVSGDWEPKYFGVNAPFKNEPNFPSARNAIQNMITRAQMHKRWWVNDPDCLLVREKTNLSIGEVQTLATIIGMSGGSMLVSDDLPKLSDERMKMIEVLLPLIGERAQVLDWFDQETPQFMRVDLDGAEGGWHLLSWSNWDKKACNISFKPSDFNLNEDEYIIRSFWDNRIDVMGKEAPIQFTGILGHGSILMAARKLEKSEAQYIGSDLHISQGLEIADWVVEANLLQMSLKLDRTFEGNIYIRLAKAPNAVLIGDEEHTWAASLEDIYVIPVESDGKEPLRITINF